ncbi:MFS transporter [Longimycelium tulufanense]|uniref:MFS transporter n=1 Tax=Longimycelium tulufanense TaxID=907463 RepID=A0A8J3CD92_9PSEU|nr:MFS transporter [Longimycelium tulufanense]GGM49210.1 MFS transporter [Longimycelium tulufanense]
MRDKNTVANPPVRLGWVLAVVVTVQFIVTLDTSVVVVALPAIRAALGFTESGLQWVVNAYVIVFGGFLLLGGRTADLYGRRRMLWWGLGLFGAASLAGGLAQTDWELVSARAVQGLGAAILAPVALTILTATFPVGHLRARALGLWSAAGAAGGAAGVLVGGVLTEYLNWRSVLLINVPVMIAAMVAGKEVPGGRPEHRVRLDVLGALLVTAGMATLVFAVVSTDGGSWTAPGTLLTFLLAIALLAGFVMVESRIAAQPLVRLGLFTTRAASGSNLTMLLLACGQFAGFYFVSLYLQQVLHFGAAVTGLAFLPFSLGFTLSSLAGSRVLDRTGPRPLAATGLAVGALGLFWFSKISVSGDFLGTVLGPSLVTSLGLGAAYVALANAATSSVAPHEAGMASGVFNSATQIGGSLGLAITVSVGASHTAALLPQGASTVEALNAGYATSLLTGACIVLVAALVALILPGRKGAAPANAPTPEPVADPAAETLR